MASRVVAVVGATASGKSALALALAERMAGEIVNADALQAYRRLEIGTGKPSATERRRVPHHLFDLLEVSERYSAGEFARRARTVIADILARGRVAIVVGGSGLYLRALFEGLIPLPQRDEALRAELRERAQLEGVAMLRAELEALDPETAARLGAADTQRIVRALEVVLATGRPLSWWIASQPSHPSQSGGALPLAETRIGLTLPRSVLYDRIDRRVRAMLAAGWVEEVRSLLAEGFEPSLPAFQAIGYRQLVRCVVHGASEQSAAEEIARATRRFAKRQETWFRRDGHIRWLDAGDGEALVSAALQLLDRVESGEDG